MDENGIEEEVTTVALPSTETRSWREKLAVSLRRGKGAVVETAETRRLRLDNEALQRTREQLARLEQSGRAAVEQGRRVVSKQVDATFDALEESRRSRIEMEEANKSKGILGRLIPKTARRVVIGTVLEYANPFTFYAYGLGDLIALRNAWTGKDMYTGDQLDKYDRRLYAIGAVVPWWPAAAVVEVAKRARRRAEDTAHVVRMVSPNRPDSNSS